MRILFLIEPLYAKLLYVMFLKGEEEGFASKKEIIALPFEAVC